MKVSPPPPRSSALRTRLVLALYLASSKADWMETLAILAQLWRWQRGNMNISYLTQKQQVQAILQKRGLL
ncbi:hypothetical protein MHYP_G00257280 [Metynnis hypsauchen]